MTDLILHHYDTSNYSEKVRLALGYKSLAWNSVTIPSVAPKPDLQALTGGYRRAPVLQIGADVYCDTRMIFTALERFKPEPELFPEGLQALAHAVAHWAETQLFRPIALYVSGSNPADFPMSLQADRAKMRGVAPPSAEDLSRAAARSAPLVRAQLHLVEGMLADGRAWALGSRTSSADFAIYHALWFIAERTGKLKFELDPFDRIRAWMGRMAEFGHGERRPMAPASALEIAGSSTPRPLGRSEPFAEDPPLGALVRIQAEDYGKESVEGELALIDRQEIGIKRTDKNLGEVVVHFPRLGYRMRAI